MKSLIVLFALTILFSGCVYDDLQFDETDFESSGMTYNYTPTIAGEQVTIGSTDYRSYMIPVLDKYNGEHYRLTLLSNGMPSVEYFRLNELTPTPNNYAPSRLVYIDTYPALVHETCNGYVGAADMYTSCQTSIYLKLDLLLVLIVVQGTSLDVSDSFSGFDYTATFTPDLTPYNSDAHTNSFINYMKIEKQ